MNISLSDPRWAEYIAGPETDVYKGFEQKRMGRDKTTNEAYITFNNCDA